MTIALPPAGLENVVVANTALSAIDGGAGRLSYAGYDIGELAQATFEEVFFCCCVASCQHGMSLLPFRCSLQPIGRCR